MQSKANFLCRSKCELGGLHLDLSTKSDLKSTYSIDISTFIEANGYESIAFGKYSTQV